MNMDLLTSIRDLLAGGDSADLYIIHINDVLTHEYYYDINDDYFDEIIGVINENLGSVIEIKAYQACKQRHTATLTINSRGGYHLRTNVPGL